MRARMKLREFVSICLLTAVLLGLLGELWPSAKAIYGSSNYFYEVTGISDTPRAVDVDSEGRIFVMTSEGDIWRSVDGGTTWHACLHSVCLTISVYFNYVFSTSSTWKFELQWNCVN